MSGLRIALCALLGAVATLVAATCIPAAASAAIISIISAGPDSSGNPYDLTVFAADANGAPITSMTAHVFDASGTDVADVAMSAVDTSNTADQQWAATTPIPQSALPPGTYTVTVDVTDSAGETDTGMSAPQPFSFSYATTLTVSADPTFVTEGSQSVTFSGSVTGQTTGSTSPAGIADAEVDLSVSGGSDAAVATTDANGNFSFTMPAITAGGDYTVSIAGTTTYSAASQDVPIDAQQASTTVSVTASPTSVTLGAESITFSGTVTALPPGGASAVPVTDAPVSLSVSGGPASQVATTDSNGNFSYQVTEASGSAEYDFAVGETPLYTQGSADVTVNASLATTTVTVTADPTSVTEGSTSVTFSGTVTALPVGGSTPEPVTDAPVDLSISSGQPTQVATTDSNGNFSYQVTGITGSADYNFSVTAGTFYTQGSDDITVNAVQAPTTVTVTPTPATVTEGSTTVAFTGTVTALPPGITAPVPIAGATVYLTVGSGSPAPVATTDANGNFSYPVTGISTTTSYVFSVNAGTFYLAGSAPVTVDAVQANTTLTLNPSSTSVTAGSTSVTFSGVATALPAGIAIPVAIAGAPVYLSVNGGTPTQVTTTDADGNFADTVSNIAATSTYTFSVGATPLYQGQSVSTTIAANQATSAISVTASPDAVFLTQPLTFTGTVTALQPGSGGTTVPVADAQVNLSVSGGPASQVATTDSNGNFSYVLTDPSQGQYEFTIGSTNLYTSASSVVGVGIDEATASMAVTANPGSVTEGSQSVTFTGTVTGMPASGGSTPMPISGASVSLSVGTASYPDVATTDANGDFSYTVSGVSNTADYDFSLTGTPEYTTATTEVQVPAVLAQTRFTGLSFAPAHLDYGQNVTITGTVQYQSGTTWDALGGASVSVKVGAFAATTVKTGATGSFTTTMQTTKGPSWSASLAATSLSDTTSASGNLIIQVPLAVKSFTANLGVLGAIGATGCLETTVPYSRGPQNAVRLQYASVPHGPWHTLGTIALHNVTGAASWCSSVGEAYFSGLMGAPSANAYYRLDYFPNNSFTGVVSSAVHAYRTQTRITGFTVSPQTVTTNGRVTISGRLWRLSGTNWVPYGRRTIVYEYNEQGTSFWGQLGSTQTSAGGYFKQVAAGGPGSFVAIVSADYQGSSTDLAVRSPGIDLSVNPAKGSVAAVAPLPAALASVAPDMLVVAADAVAVSSTLEQAVKSQLN